MAITNLPTKARYTTTDVIDAVREVHNCLHTVEGKVDVIKETVEDVKERLARVEGYQAGVAVKLGVAPSSPEPSFGQKHKVPIATAGAVIAAMATFTAAYPFLRGLFMVLDNYLMHAPK